MVGLPAPERRLRRLRSSGSAERQRHRELNRVYREHVGAVYAFFAYAVSQPTAEDLAASTFERVIRAWESFDPRRASERTWIMTIARNMLADHFRRQRYRNATSLDAYPSLLELLADVDDPFQRTLDLDELRGWLSQLGTREQEILALRYGADLASADIARVMDLTTANVQQIISRSLRRLRGQIGLDAVS